jgi:hypothetical protein
MAKGYRCNATRNSHDMYSTLVACLLLANSKRSFPPRRTLVQGNSERYMSAHLGRCPVAVSAAARAQGMPFWHPLTEADGKRAKRAARLLYSCEA